MDAEYTAHVRAQELAYLLAYEEWEKSVSPEERLLLGAAAAPDLDQHSRMQTGRADDVASSSRASYTPDVADGLDGPVEDLMEKFGMSSSLARAIEAWSNARVEREAEERKTRTIVRIAGVFLNTSNARLSAAGLAYASDLALTSGLGSMREYAGTIGLSVEMVSKTARWWRAELELPVGSHMKGAGHCKKLSEAQQQKHWRKAKYGSGNGKSKSAGGARGGGAGIDHHGDGNGGGGGTD